MGKLTYLFRNQFTDVVKVYKAMTLAQAKTANAQLSQDASNCRWFPDPLIATPLFGDSQAQAVVPSSDDERSYVGRAEVYHVRG